MPGQPASAPTGPATAKAYLFQVSNSTYVKIMMIYVNSRSCQSGGLPPSATRSMVFRQRRVATPQAYPAGRSVRCYPRKLAPLRRGFLHARSGPNISGEIQGNSSSAQAWRRSPG